MTAMDVKLPYINAALSKSGKRYYYYQRKGRSVPIRHDGKPCVPDDPNFAAAYAAAKNKWESHRIESVKRFAPGSVGDLIERFEISPAFEKYQSSTKKNYSEQFERLKSIFGDVPAAELTSAAIATMQDRIALGNETRKGAPRTADMLVARLDTIFSFGVRRGLVSLNPAAVVQPQHKSRSYEPWPQDVLDDYLARGRVDLARVILWGYRTGLRLGDLLRIERSMIDGEKLVITPQKTKEVKPDPLYIPLHSDLLRDWNGRPGTPIRFVLTNTQGRRWTTSGFRSSLKKDLRRLGLPIYQPHGLRYNAIESFFESGCSVAEVISITRQSPEMASKYAAKFERFELAKSAMEKLDK